MKIFTELEIISSLDSALDCAERGEVILIKRGRRIFRLTAELVNNFPLREELRQSMQESPKDSAEYLADDRNS